MAEGVTVDSSIAGLVSVVPHHRTYRRETETFLSEG